VLKRTYLADEIPFPRQRRRLPIMLSSVRKRYVADRLRRQPTPPGRAQDPVFDRHPGGEHAGCTSVTRRLRNTRCAVGAEDSALIAPSAEPLGSGTKWIPEAVCGKVILQAIVRESLDWTVSVEVCLSHNATVGGSSLLTTCKLEITALTKCCKTVFGSFGLESFHRLGVITNPLLLSRRVDSR
jgi:hypothetical protein